MRRRTPAQMRRQMLRRPRRLPPIPFDTVIAEAENRAIQGHCKNRMVVFDAAPKAIRDRANETGDTILHTWWETLDEYQQEHVLETGRLPSARPRRSGIDAFWDSLLSM